MLVHPKVWNTSQLMTMVACRVWGALVGIYASDAQTRPCRLFVHPAWRRMPFLSSPAPEALVFSTAFPLAAGSSSLSTGSWEADPWRTDEILLTSQSWELNTLFDWRSFTASPRWAHLPNNITAWIYQITPPPERNWWCLTTVILAATHQRHARTHTLVSVSTL